jgi:hypothetical protein
VWAVAHSEDYSYGQGNKYTLVEAKAFTILDLEQVLILNTWIGCYESKTNLPLEVEGTLNLNNTNGLSIKNYTSPVHKSCYIHLNDMLHSKFLGGQQNVKC